jgi:hypothetical protein
MSLPSGYRNTITFASAILEQIAWVSNYNEQIELIIISG